MFRLLAKDAGPPIASRAGTEYPLEAEKDRIRASARIEQILAPLPHARSSAASSFTTIRATQQDSGSLEKLFNTVLCRLANRPQQQDQGPKGKGRNRDKDRGKGHDKRGGGKQERLLAPKELIGMSPRTDSNEPRCLNFNLNGCTDVAPGARCTKGWHECMHAPWVQGCKVAWPETVSKPQVSEFAH